MRTTLMAYQVASNPSQNLRKGPWLEEEDEQLVTFITIFGDRKWDFIGAASGLRRSGKSCRLRWLNYLRPNLKRGQISPEEEQIIIQLHELWGNRWAKIARRLPGRTDNEIKNYWRSHLRKKLQAQEGNFQEKVNITTQDLSCQNSDQISWNSSLEETCKSVDNNNNEGITNSSPEQYKFSELTYLNSPYETRIYDWMPAELPSEHNGMIIHGDCDGLSSCFCYLMKWNSEDSSDYSLIGSIWDLN